MALKHIKLKIQSVKKTSTVTRAMEAVSAVKMRKAQERALGGRAYAAAALTILKKISGSTELKQHPLTKGTLEKTAFIVVTSDKGLAGSLNSAVIKRTEAEISRRNFHRVPEEKWNPADSANPIIAVGRRGGDYLANRGYKVKAKYENLKDSVSEFDILEITNTVLKWHSAGEIDSCIIIYTNFVSTFEQKAVARVIVPITPEVMNEMVAGIVPAKGKYAGIWQGENWTPSTYSIEPDVETVVNELMPKLLNIAVFHAILEAKASEHSARMVAMKSATDKA